MFGRKKDAGDTATALPSSAEIASPDPLMPKPVRRMDDNLDTSRQAPRPLTPSAAHRPMPTTGPAGVRRPEGEHEGKKLIVGRDISLNGKITSCDRLIVEGSVEASLTDCRVMEVSEMGMYKGDAEVETAEISGKFEGSLTVRERLLVRASGKVAGQVRYGSLEVERGGQLTGDINLLNSGPGKPAV